MTILTRNPDHRSYDLISSVGELRTLFDTLGFAHSTIPGADGVIHRWQHGRGIDKTVLLLFPCRDGRPPRLSMMGPVVPQVDALAGESEVAL
jgi:hypothetical protein